MERIVWSLPSRMHERLAWLVCLVPAGFLALFYSFVIRARLALGTWPQPYQPDPKQLGFGIHHAAVVLGVAFWLASPLLLVVLAGIWPRFERRRLVLPAVVLGVSYVVAWLVVRIDPGAFMAWFAD